MRLWTIHPKYLDARGLVALWREALLARAVLGGKTRGYRHHPQLIRFREHPTPRLAINAYVADLHREATRRGYSFDARKIGPVRAVAPIRTTSGQVAYEWRHLLKKLAVRSPAVHSEWRAVRVPRCHPLFTRKAGPIEHWERRKN
jgi:hypothetical protein